MGTSAAGDRWAGRGVAVIIPAYEADGRLAGTLASVPEWVGVRIVVDDGSRTPIRLPAASPGTVVVRHDRNLGVGAAILTGYREARRRGVSVAAVMAADGQMDPDDLAGLVAPVADGRADYVTGDRLSHPDCPRVMPGSRRLGNLGLTFLTRVVTGRWDLMDSQCGYSALNLDLLDRLPLDWIYPRYGFPNDLLAAVVGAGGRVSQVTVRPIYRGEPSRIRPMVALWVYPLVVARGLVVRIAAWARARGSRRRAGGSSRSWPEKDGREATRQDGRCAS